MSTPRESIASEVESLALQAQAAALYHVHDLLHYIAGAIEKEREDVILDIIREATAQALIESNAGRYDEENDR